MGYGWIGGRFGGDNTMDELRELATACIEARRELAEMNVSDSWAVEEHMRLCKRVDRVATWARDSLRNGGPLPPPEDLFDE